MSDCNKIVELYTELANTPQKDFGWAKGLDNAKAHGYKQAWIDAIPLDVWNYCAAVGNPFQTGVIQEGDKVLDLGCGAGVDLLVSSLLTGEGGEVIGVDMTPAMVQKAQEHAKLMNAKNISVIKGSIEQLEIADESIDVVISNGAINLAGCKDAVFTEAFRVLKSGGTMVFSDMVNTAEKSSCCSAPAQEDWANCVAGTLQKEEVVAALEKAGFTQVACLGLNHYQTSETTFGATFLAKK